jgi:putative DNA primase/helicase
MIADLLKDFPFDNETSLSVAMAELITAVVRRVLPIAPFFANCASCPGSGKTLLAKMASLLAAGKAAVVVSIPRDGDELRKRLAACLLAGDPVICLDNLSFDLRSDDLCAIATSSEWSERMLGHTQNLRLPTNSLFVITGNNLVFAGDLCQRVLKTRLVPDVARPDQREFDRDIVEYIIENRGKLVAAILTLIRAYICAGEPDVGVKPFREFKLWSSFVQKPLVWLGYADPCASQVDLYIEDPEYVEKKAVVTALADFMRIFPSESFTAKQIIDAVEDESRRETNEEYQTLYQILSEYYPDRSGRISAKLFGKKLSKIKDSIIANYVIKILKKDKIGAIIWKIFDLSKIKKS